MKRILLTTFCLLIVSSAKASNTEINLAKFSAGDMSGWKEQTIGLLKPKTTYKLTKDNDRTALIARSTKSASGQIYKLNLDPKEYPTLKWSWKIDHIIKKGDEKTKEGDDFSARVYVLFPRGFFAKTRAICYVWANKLPKGEYVASPFTPNIITVAVDSGEELAGRWTFHQRNLYEDYRIYFGEEPPKIGAIALMTDTDNTAESAIGYYGDISLLRSLKTPEAKQKDHKPKDSAQKETKPKDLTNQGTKNNGEPSLPPPALPAIGTAAGQQKQREPNGKEQPDDTPTPSPTAAPLPSAPK